jgi:DNA repair exonuclease SbcCD ATPase subunit
MPSPETNNTIATVLISALTGASGLKILEKLLDRFWTKGDRKADQLSIFQGQLFDASVGASEKMRGELWTRFVALETKVETLNQQLGDARAEIERQKDVIDAQKNRIAALENTEKAYIKLQERFVDSMLEYAQTFSQLGTQHKEGAQADG